MRCTLNLHQCNIQFHPRTNQNQEVSLLYWLRVRWRLWMCHTLPGEGTLARGWLGGRLTIPSRPGAEKPYTPGMRGQDWERPKIARGVMRASYWIQGLFQTAIVPVHFHAKEQSGHCAIIFWVESFIIQTKKEKKKQANLMAHYWPSGNTLETDGFPSGGINRYNYLVLRYWHN